MKSTESVFGSQSYREQQRSNEPATASVDQHETDSAPADEPSAETPDTSTAAASGAPDQATDDDDEGSYGPEPTDLDGFRRNLSAARKGEKKWKKQARELQRQFDQLSGHVSALRGGQHTQTQQPKADEAQPAEKTPDFYEDPSAFVRHEADSRFNRVNDIVRQQEVRFQRTRINDLVENFVERVEDGKEHIDYFTALAARDPQLKAQFESVIDSGGNGVKFAYEFAKAHKQATEMSDPAAYEAKLRAKWEAERNGGQIESTPKAPTKAPKSIATSRGTGGASKQAWSGPRSSEQTFGAIRR